MTKPLAFDDNAIHLAPFAVLYLRRLIFSSPHYSAQTQPPFQCVQPPPFQASLQTPPSIPPSLAIDDNAAETS